MAANALPAQVAIGDVSGPHFLSGISGSKAFAKKSPFAGSACSRERLAVFVVRRRPRPTRVARSDRTPRRIQGGDKSVRRLGTVAKRVRVFIPVGHIGMTKIPSLLDGYRARVVESSLESGRRYE
jgi:hypothetical protein